jgi:hypothetical protein
MFILSFCLTLFYLHIGLIARGTRESIYFIKKVIFGIFVLLLLVLFLSCYIILIEFVDYDKWQLDEDSIIESTNDIKITTWRIRYTN